MLKWITEKLTRTEDDSLASESGLRAFLETLPAAKPSLALQDIGQHFADAAGLALDGPDCRRALLRLDDSARSFVDQSWQALFGDGAGKVIFDGPWHDLVNFHRNLYCGYAYCLDQLPPPDTIDEKARQDAILLSGRAMAALVTHKALMRIRYRDAHSAFWSETQALLARGLRYEFAQAPIKLYPGAVQQTTLEREYVTGLLFDVAPTGNMLPTQSRCLHRILQRFNEHYRLTESYSVRTPFFIEPAKDKPPQRWLVGLKARSGMRFFGIGPAYRDLGALQKAARTDAAVPEWLQHSGIDAERYRALLDMLVEHWSQNPPQRRSRRDRHAATILVTQGLSQIYRMLAYSKFAREGRQISYIANTILDPKLFKDIRFGSVNKDCVPELPDQILTPMELLHKFELAGDRELTERWSIIDASEHGLGAVAEHHRGWLRAGMLIGFRYHDNIEWQLAIVRRVGRTAQSRLSVGLQCLTEKTEYARLRLDKARGNESWIAAGMDTDAYADAVVVGDAQPVLIAAPGTYEPEWTCTLRIGQSVQKIQFGDLLESGVDFERIAYSPIE